MPTDTSTDSASFQFILDAYRENVQPSEAWFNLRTVLWNQLGRFTEEDGSMAQNGVRFFFEKEAPGGHSALTLTQPDVNRAKPGKFDSMFAHASCYAIPFVVDFFTMNDLGAVGAKKESAMINFKRLLMRWTESAAKQQEFLCIGNGDGALAFAASTHLVPGAGLTLLCDITADASPGHTKGAGRLMVNEFYQSFDPTTGLPEGTFQVTSSFNKTQATITLLNGIITAGNPLSHPGYYRKVPMGLNGLIDDTARLLQGRDTSVDTILNVPTIDLDGDRLTVSEREDAKTILVNLNYDNGARTNLTWVTTPGLMSDLRKQQYGFRRMEAGEAAKDITKVYQDVDGSTIIEVPDFDEDRHIGFKNDILKKFVEFDFQDINPDQVPFRNLLGVNQTGSIFFSKFKASKWTCAIKDTRAGVCIKRASTDGVTTQIVSGF